MSNHHIEVPAPPTDAGQRIRIISWGGPIQLGWVGVEGVVVRFNRNGKPVVQLDLAGREFPRYREVTDRFGSAVLVDENGALVKIQKELPR